MKKILVVDDNQQNIYLLQVLLGNSGYEVEQAPNGLEALEKAHSDPPALVISDILMPVMDGFALCRTWKQDEQLKHIPFVFYTATYTEASDEAFALSLGAERFITKPAEPEAFLAMVNQALENHAAGKLAAASNAEMGDEQYLKAYNAALVRKLEDKVLELEQKNLALQAEFSRRAQEQEKLRLSEAKYRKLHESMIDGFAYVDMQGKLLDFNESYREMLGYTAEELAHLTYMDLTPQKWHAYERSILEEQILTQGYSQIYSKEYRRKDGTLFPVELRTFLIRNEQGEHEGMWAIVRDITERQKAEEVIRQSRDKLQSVFRVAPTGIGVVVDRVIAEVNQRICEMTGYASEELLGHNARLLYPTQEEFEFVGREKYTQIAAQGRGEVETHWQRKDGTILDILLASTPIDLADISRGVIFTALDITDRKQAEAALRQSEELYRKMIENSPLGMHFYKLEHGKLIFTSANPAANKLTGVDNALFIGKTIEEAFPPLIQTDVPIHYHAAAENGVPWITEQVDYDDGRIRGAFEVKAFQTAPKNMVAIFADVTARKQAEQELHTSREHLQAVLDSVNDAVFVDDADTGQIIAVNQRMCEMYGYTQEEALRIPVGDLSQGDPPYDQAHALAWLGRARTTGPQVFPWWAKRKDGSLFWTEISIRFVVIGGQNRFVVTARDITERKQAEEALRQLNDLLSLFIKNSPIFTFIKEVTPTVSRVLIASENFQEMVGIPGSRMAGMTMEELFPLEFASKITTDDWVVATSGQVLKIDEDLNGRNYTTIKFPITQGERRLLAGYTIDITERRHAEEEIHLLNASLEQRVEQRTKELHMIQDQLLRQERLAVLGQLAGGVGHELRNPLAVINNAAYYLKLIQPDADEKVKQYLSMIEKETRTADKIITDLLDFARVKSVEKEPVAALDLVEHMLARFSIPEDVQVKIKTPRTLPRLCVDIRQVEQVLGNLAVNACQAMKDGGSLTISGAVHGKELAIAVKDTGVGISPENMEKIFEPLFTTKLKGIGLGLAVSRKLAEANGGRIEARSHPGKGSTFTLYLPIEESGNE